MLITLGRPAGCIPALLCMKKAAKMCFSLGELSFNGGVYRLHMHDWGRVSSCQVQFWGEGVVTSEGNRLGAKNLFHVWLVLITPSVSQYKMF